MMRVAYTGKPMSPADMDRGNHTRGRSCTQWSMNMHL